MDGLIVLLILFGVLSRLGKRKKKQPPNQQAKKRSDAPPVIQKLQQIAEESAEQGKSFDMKGWEKAFADVQRKAEAESEAFRAEMLKKNSIEPPKEPRPAPAGLHKAKATVEKRRNLPEGASAPLRAVQGESDADHRRHVEKIVREEKQRKEEAQAQANLRNEKRKKLREAVIMSEVLGKPLALRGGRSFSAPQRRF